MTDPLKDDIDRRCQEFADGVTELAKRLRIGVEGGTLYMMEGDDYLFRYACDDESRLIRTA